MDNRDRLRLKIIILRLIRDDKAWFRRRGIYISRKTDYWMLNYLPDERNRYNRLTRGILIRKPASDWDGNPFSLIVSFPFTRFFNLNEQGAASIDLSNSEMLEKLDGTMVGVFFPTRNPAEPAWQTRKLTSLNAYDRELTISTFNGKTFNLIESIGSYVKKLPYDASVVGKTLVFEFIHESSQIVTKYDPSWYGLYLLAARDISTFAESSEDELDAIARKLPCYRARRWDAKEDYPQIEAIYAEMNKVTPNFEGFIFRDRATGQRVKVKNTDYLLRHHLLNALSYKNLLPLIRKGETGEVIAYFPHAAKRIDAINAATNALLKEVAETCARLHREFADRKALALHITANFVKTPKESFIKDCVFSTFKMPETQFADKILELFDALALGKGKQAGQPKKVLEILGLIEDNIDTEI